VLQQTVNLDSSKANSVELLINQLQGHPRSAKGYRVHFGARGARSEVLQPSENANAQNDKRTRIFGIDEKFIPNYGLTILAGRNFDKDKAGRQRTPPQPLNIILNETASKVLGFAKPRGGDQSADGRGPATNLPGHRRHQ